MKLLAKNAKMVMKFRRVSTFIAIKSLTVIKQYFNYQLDTGTNTVCTRYEYVKKITVSLYR